MTVKMIREFLKLEAASGIFLIFAMIVALVCANSPLAGIYDLFLQTPVQIRIGALDLAKPLLLWINDGLMAVFFLLIGLEVKREVLEGELSSLPQIALPAIAAVGGMAIPALIYVWFNWENPVHLSGWAIPTATDIAFALGILALLGKRVPGSLKLFLMTLAILDDLGAIVIIALFYTSDLSLLSLVLAAAAIAVLISLNRLKVVSIAPYMVIGIFLWICVLKSGVHATLAGVVLAFAIPLRSRDGEVGSPLRHLEHALHPWVAFAILPLFAFANAGVSFSGMSLGSLLKPLPLGITAGLFLGKQLGIAGFSWLGIRLGLANLPSGVRWLEFYGMAMLCGIGFTMSLFVTSLVQESSGVDAFSGARLGVLVGSLFSALGGYLLLRFALRRNGKPVNQL